MTFILQNVQSQLTRPDPTFLLIVTSYNESSPECESIKISRYYPTPIINRKANET
jgi:hypothetical protein